MKKWFSEARLMLIALPVLVWTLLPVYHIFLFAFSAKDKGFSGNLLPTEPTMQNLGIVLQQKHFYLHHFWSQIGSSLLIALSAGAITLIVRCSLGASCAWWPLPSGRGCRTGEGFFMYDDRPMNSFRIQNARPNM